MEQGSMRSPNCNSHPRTRETKFQMVYLRVCVTSSVNLQIAYYDLLGCDMNG